MIYSTQQWIQCSHYVNMVVMKCSCCIVVDGGYSILILCA